MCFCLSSLIFSLLDCESADGNDDDDEDEDDVCPHGEDVRTTEENVLVSSR